MTPHDRRALLSTRGNPLKSDYLAVLEGPSARLAYVPDKLVLDPAAFAGYLASLAELAWPSPEALGAALLEDINDVLVPRWLRVTLRADAAGVAHRLVLEDRQPRWANDRLLAAVNGTAIA